MINPPRQTQPRRWTSLAIASVTLATTPAFADMRSPAPITLATPDALLWLAQDQGGEAGEAGITTDAAPATAYLAELSIIEGHMLAARDLYAMGHKDNAVDLSQHPSQEGTLADLVTRITAHGAVDPSAAIAGFTATMASGAAQADVDAALTTVSQAFAAAAVSEADKTRMRFDAVVLLLKAAAGEYSAAIENGAVADEMGWHEAYSFTALAGLRLQDLATQPQSAKAATRALAALGQASAAFGDPMAETPLAGDPQILLGIAASVELIASSVR